MVKQCETAHFWWWFFPPFFWFLGGWPWVAPGTHPKRVWCLSLDATDARSIQEISVAGFRKVICWSKNIWCFLLSRFFFFLSFFFFLPPFLFGEFWISDGMEDSTWFCPPGICQSLRRSWYVCTMIFEIILASMPGRWQGWQGWQLCFLPMADDFLIALSWDIFLWLNSMVYGC